MDTFMPSRYCVASALENLTPVTHHDHHASFCFLHVVWNGNSLLPFMLGFFFGLDT